MIAGRVTSDKRFQSHELRLHKLQQKYSMFVLGLNQKFLSLVRNTINVMILFNMRGHAMITRKHTTRMNYSTLIKGAETPPVSRVNREVSVHEFANRKNIGRIR